MGDGPFTALPYLPNGDAHVPEILFANIRGGFHFSIPQGKSGVRNLGWGGERKRRREREQERRVKWNLGRWQLKPNEPERLSWGGGSLKIGDLSVTQR